MSAVAETPTSPPLRVRRSATRWGVYGLQGKNAAGAIVPANDPTAVRWFVRWRYDGGSPRKRTFNRKTHARVWRDLLIKAQVLNWPADEYGYPIDPAQTLDPAQTDPVGHTVESYCRTVWWPTYETQFGDKNRLGHRRNMEVAIDLLRYPAHDHRLTQPGRHENASIFLSDLIADDCKAAVTARSQMNARAAATNQRRTTAALSAGQPAPDPIPETASTATVRAFFITLGMIVRSARDSDHLTQDPMRGVAALARKPKPARVTERIVPSVEEVFALADAIATLGPVMDNGYPTGDRFRALVLLAGTAGARPGELVAHHPDLIEWGTPNVVTFTQTEGAVYDAATNLSGRRTRPLKHRDEGDARHVPLLDAVAHALREHLDRGYALPDRTFPSQTGTAPLDWGNIRETYWRTACEMVFAGTAKAALAAMPPKTLRKAAITFWLDSGINPTLVADWAGHSEDITRRHYAGRSAATFHREAEMLAAGRENLRPTVGSFSR